MVINIYSDLHHFITNVLMVNGGDSYSDGWDIKSRRRILDGHFSDRFGVKIVMFDQKD